MAHLDSPQDVVEAALAGATSDGTVVIVTDRSEANLRWANSSLTTNGEMSSRSATVVATTGRGDGASAGVVGRTVTDTNAVRELVAEAEAAARAATAAPDAAPLVTPDQAGAGSDFALEPETTSVGAFAPVAADLGEAFAAGGAARQHFGFAEQVVDSVYLGSSTGLRLRHVQPTGRLEMNAKNADWSSSSYLAFSLRDPSEADVAAADAELARRLGWAERRLDLPAGRYETILPPNALADLLVEAYWESGARAADEGRSAYSGKLGERLSRLPLELFSDPTRPGLECAPFVVATASTSDTSVFDNGLPLPRQDVLAKGELVSFTGSRAYAAAHDTPVRLESDNLVLEAPGATDGLDDLVATTQRGLLLSTLWYIRVVDPQTLLLTGLTRDGVYLVEGGEVVGAVNNFRWNESPLDVLDRITEAGATQRCYPREWGDWFTRAAMPPVRVSDFNMSSVSLAQ
ncbi:MAG: metallopeptidase TldD-related protein [Lapillicoccus sp.]